MQVPVLETPSGPIFESNSIARYSESFFSFATYSESFFFFLARYSESFFFFLPDTVSLSFFLPDTVRLSFLFLRGTVRLSQHRTRPLSSSLLYRRGPESVSCALRASRGSPLCSRAPFRFRPLRVVCLRIGQCSPTFPSSPPPFLSSSLNPKHTPFMACTPWRAWFAHPGKPGPGYHARPHVVQAGIEQCLEHGSNYQLDVPTAIPVYRQHFWCTDCAPSVPTAPTVQACIDQWLDFGSNEIYTPTFQWASPLYGMGPRVVEVCPHCRSAFVQCSGIEYYLNCSGIEYCLNCSVLAHCRSSVSQPPPFFCCCCCCCSD